MIKIAPSVLSADFADMKNGIRLMERAGADLLHFDVMDGIFVPNITFGFKMIKDVKRITNIPLDTHLMIDQPDRYVEQFAKAGSDIVTFHVEATVHVQRTLAAIRDCGVKAGVALNPATPLDTVRYVLDDVDMILLMSVNPGFGGQMFLPAMLDKARELRAMVDAHGKGIAIEMDGGISLANIKDVVEAGVNVIVAGSAIFGADDPAAMVQSMKGICN